MRSSFATSLLTLCSWEIFWKRSARFRAQQGMIGFEVLRRFVTQIDYGRKTLTFIDPAAFDPAGSGTPVAFVFYSHLPQVAGSFEGIPGQFDIDTGSRVLSQS